NNSNGNRKFSWSHTNDTPTSRRKRSNHASAMRHQQQNFFADNANANGFARSEMMVASPQKSSWMTPPGLHGENSVLTFGNEVEENRRNFRHSVEQSNDDANNNNQDHNRQPSTADDSNSNNHSNPSMNNNNKAP